VIVVTSLMFVQDSHSVVAEASAFGYTNRLSNPD